jgi:MOSC domain-containing protein YiiM
MPTVHSINVSNGGVPKTARLSAFVGAGGLVGDRQRDRRFHGGPDRAVCLYSLELIRALDGEGHPITPGSIGENLTLSGIEWARLGPGSRLAIGQAALEITSATAPCKKIAASFRDGVFTRVSEKVRPGWSRYYARVLAEGLVTVGDTVLLLPR